MNLQEVQSKTREIIVGILGYEPVGTYILSKDEMRSFLERAQENFGFSPFLPDNVRLSEMADKINEQIQARLEP